ncbi:MAG: pyruvate, phosphate dikinase [Armatimonadetes bacterium]|nr:pyruvate, phosphate dikinase [Armatimonadota bacterium]
MADYKMVYLFGEQLETLQANTKAEGRELRDLLGGKGANLAIMVGAGLPVPPGFTVTVDTCNAYSAAGGQMPAGLEEEIRTCLAGVEQETGKQFGDPSNPLLVSVRSGARESMPGMMDTVLNLGMNDEVAAGMIELFQNERFVWDAYRRLIMMFGNVVMGLNREKFEECLDEVKHELGVEEDTAVGAEAMKRVVELEKQVYQELKGEPFPQDPMAQLIAGVRAVFDSADTARAIEYRRIHKLPQSMRTAVNVQTMVFGNMGDDSGTGVAFTRDPATGEKVLYGDYLVNAQGEDVVAGLRTPMKIQELEQKNPAVYQQFLDICAMLEKHYKNVQDVEFTVERGKLWMLQTRNAKRTAQAAVKIACDLVDEGIIKGSEVIMQIDPDQLDHLLHSQFDPEAKAAATVLAVGVDASPGAAAGRVVFTADEAVEWDKKGEKVILVRRETAPDDVGGMKASQGILTAVGGKSSHAAIVGRQLGTPCVVGCSAITIDYAARQFKVGDCVVKQGDWISIDGADGKVMDGAVAMQDSDIFRVLRGELPAEESAIYGYFHRVMAWADEVRVIGVRTNADRPEDAALAIQLGAEGIGLTRTEHMFFDDPAKPEQDRLRTFQKMILAETEEERAEGAAGLLPFQREDFEGILKAMDGKPVIIRLLDPPLHEFIPSTAEDREEVAKLTGKTPQEIRDAAQALHELNPMLGHRGCRLGVTRPELYKMQVRAIFEAACALKQQGLNPIPEVMIPLVGSLGEFTICREYTEQIAQAVMAETGVQFDYLIGTMIELPRACIIADKIAQKADFFSFGTNDLTQTTFGFSRDDVEGRFFDEYIKAGVFEQNPFAVLDREGVGELVKMGTERGRATSPKLEVGICGEHGGERLSVTFCHEVGMDYVSCSPLRVPIARLAAAQAQVRKPR